MHYFNLQKFGTSALGSLPAFRIVALTGLLSFAALFPARTQTVSFVNPPGGATAGGTRVTLYGTGFGAGTQVRFGFGNYAPSVTVESSTKMTVITPAHAAGPVDVYLSGGSIGRELFTYVDVSNTADTDGDGLNDAAELTLAGLGFNYQVAQPALVESFLSGNALYASSQLQALLVGSPLIQKDALTGKFKMTIGMMKSTNLATAPFSDFPMNGAGADTSINDEGKLNFEFTASDNAAFFRLLARPPQPPQQFTFSSAVADFQQGAPYVIDNSLNPDLPGWGVFGGTQAARTGYFLFAGPASGEMLELTLRHDFGEQHWIQQFEIAVTTDAVPNTTGGGNWTTWVPTTFASTSTTLSLIGGTNFRSTGTAATATYTLRGAFPVQGITGVRLTCHPFDYDASDALPATVGHSLNGNFVLSQFKAAASRPE